MLLFKIYEIVFEVRDFHADVDVLFAGVAIEHGVDALLGIAKHTPTVWAVDANASHLFALRDDSGGVITSAVDVCVWDCAVIVPLVLCPCKDIRAGV